MTELYIPRIISTRWKECVEAPSTRNYEALCTLLDAFLFDIMRAEPDNALGYALKGLKDEAKRRIKEMMPKGE